VVALSASAQAQEESRAVEAREFSKIIVEGVYELDVTVGEAWSVSLTGDAERLARSVVTVENGALTLATKKRARGEKRPKEKSEGVKAVIVMPKLDALKVSGVADARIAGVAADDLAIELSGVGDIDVAGACGRFDATVAGVGDLDAKALTCKSATLRLSGVGSASIYASESVDVKVSGMGDVSVFGSPKSVTTSKSMFSDITVE